MIPKLNEVEEHDLYWREGDHFKIRSVIFSVTQSKPDILNNAWKNIHFIAIESGTGQTISGKMTLSGDVPNGPTLLLQYCRGDWQCPYALISMTNRAWVHEGDLLDVPLYKNTERYKRLAEPPLISALGGFAQIGWRMAVSLFTKRDEELQRINDTLHRFLHRIAFDCRDYWQGGGGEVAGKL